MTKGKYSVNDLQTNATQAPMNVVGSVSLNGNTIRNSIRKEGRKIIKYAGDLEYTTEIPPHKFTQFTIMQASQIYGGFWNKPYDR